MVTFSMTFTDPLSGFQGHGIFEIEYLTDKVTTAQYWETIPNIWNGTMLVTLTDL